MVLFLICSRNKVEDLLRVLGKLVNDKIYCDSDIDNLTWFEKNKLIKSDPVTCARYFDFRLQMFLNKVLRHEIEPIFFSASSFSKEVLLMFTFYFGLIELQNLVLIQKKRLGHS